MILRYVSIWKNQRDIKEGVKETYHNKLGSNLLAYSDTLHQATIDSFFILISTC